MNVAANGRSDLVTITATARGPRRGGARWPTVSPRSSSSSGARRIGRRSSTRSNSSRGRSRRSKREGTPSARTHCVIAPRSSTCWARCRLATRSRSSAPSARQPGVAEARSLDVLGLLLGGLLGIGLVLLRARLDRRLRTTEALEEAFGRPVLALVPVAKEFDTGNPPHVRAEEAFSTLWTNLRYFNVTRKIDSVIVTSTRSGDGKTTVALNLASRGRTIGSRVLLLEADLRRPSLWARIAPGRPQLGGLTQVLAGRHGPRGRDDHARDERRRGDQRHRSRNSFVVRRATCRRTRPRCSTPSRCGSCCERSREQYDLVVIDAPPSTVVPDAIPIMQQVSAVLVVARAERRRATRRPS